MATSLLGLVDLQLDPEGALTPEGTQYGDAWPFEPLPVQTMNVEQFSYMGLQLMQRLTESHHPADALRFVRFVLSGRRYTNDPTQPFRQIRLDVRSQQAPFNPRDVVVAYDIDSVIGYVPGPIRMLPGHALSLSAVPNFRDTLTTDNHLKIKITPHASDPDDWYMVRCHHVPNMCIGKLGLRAKVLACFPALHISGATGHRAVSQEDIKTWFEDVIRPAVHAIDPARLTGLPPSYDAAVKQQKSHTTGRFHFSTFDIAGEVVERLCIEIQRLAAKFNSFKGMYFLLEFRGMKGVTRTVVARDATTADILNSRRAGIVKAITPLNPDMLIGPGNKFWVDVAEEFSLPGHVLMLDRAAHATVLETVFPLITRQQAEAAVVRQAYSIDTFAQVYQFAGARWPMDLQNENWEQCQYYQAYFTVKTLTYSMERDNVHAEVRGTDTLPTNISKLCGKLAASVDAVREAFITPSRDSQEGATGLDGAVRVEARINWTRADNIMTCRPSDEELLHILIATQRAPVWSLVWLRLTGIATVLDTLRQASMHARAESSVGAMAAAMVFMLNSLFVREADYAKDRALRMAVGRRLLTDDDLRNLDPNSPSETVGEQHGIFYISDAWMQGEGRDRVFHLPAASEVILTMRGWLIYYGVQNYSAYVDNFPGVGVLARGERHPGRTSNRRRNVRMDVDYVQQHITTAPVGFNVQGITPLPHRTPISDQPGFLGGHHRLLREDDGEGLDDEDESFVDDANTFLEKIFRQFGMDIWTVAPNERDTRADSYLKYPVVLRTSMTADLLRTPDMRGIFDKVRVTQGDHKAWGRTFNHYFPNKGFRPPTGGFQHYPGTNYFPRWLTWVNHHLSQPHVHLVRRELKKKFNELAWVPHAESDRMWVTRKPKREKATLYRLPHNFDSTSVRVILNPHLKVKLADVCCGHDHPGHPQLIRDLLHPRSGSGRTAPADGGEFSSDEEGMDLQVDDHDD